VLAGGADPDGVTTDEGRLAAVRPADRGDAELEGGLLLDQAEPGRGAGRDADLAALGAPSQVGPASSFEPEAATPSSNSWR
jgi:hypothetical protein